MLFFYCKFLCSVLTLFKKNPNIPKKIQNKKPGSGLSVTQDSDRTDKIVSNKGLVKQLTKRSVIKNVHVWCPTIFILYVELLKMAYTNVVVKLYKIL